ncbi:hypothetical protein [Leisingera sp. JC1]|uniref:hypothetical protein n=1 Tax=Leisingera sp. JC1 TaxID=1855282 RepID=UPI000803A31C|nr:hypothetical protein [Leisingera sp. JC1]OBY25688.1 hypothetical protein A9D60_21165 [Leisingera sp. JC1]
MHRLAAGPDPDLTSPQQVARPDEFGAQAAAEIQLLAEGVGPEPAQRRPGVRFSVNERSKLALTQFWCNFGLPQIRALERAAL